MVYQVYLKDMVLPITPSAISYSINNKNTTIDLINEGEVNILKNKGLDNISFSFIAPSVKYPFMHPNADVTKKADYYIERLNKFKADKEVINFIVMRDRPNGAVIFLTNIKVTVEGFDYEENAENGFDFTISVTLKEYKEYGTQKITVTKNSNNKTSATVSKDRKDTKTNPKTYTVKKGDTLWVIAKKYLGKGSRYNEIAKLNKISNPNFIQIGKVLKLP